MSVTTVIMLGGFFNLGFAVFHLLFWRLFDWKRDLASLRFINRQVMQILNFCLIFTFLIFAYLSFFHPTELLATGLGRSLLFLIALFWLLRAAEQVVFFGLHRRLSLALFFVFLAGTALYAYPWISSMDT
ncbi:hypothetical protein [Microbulbifer halophilus]|uniref:Uncharacterized protein n=1 Tax=Microbulbifer halophilus TaxID=453963 RepID=A0ABW5EM44_9GAMM|nr:hypothetical protein [Microbulbifer halophilus]MCW8127162.1 hypothetical protein [Microbulbifer halophilus]